MLRKKCMTVTMLFNVQCYSGVDTRASDILPTYAIVTCCKILSKCYIWSGNRNLFYDQLLKFKEYRPE